MFNNAYLNFNDLQLCICLIKIWSELQMSLWCNKLWWVCQNGQRPHWNEQAEKKTQKRNSLFAENEKRLEFQTELASAYWMHTLSIVFCFYSCLHVCIYQKYFGHVYANMFAKAKSEYQKPVFNFFGNSCPFLRLITSFRFVKPKNSSTFKLPYSAEICTNTSKRIHRFVHVFKTIFLHIFCVFFAFIACFSAALRFVLFSSLLVVFISLCVHVCPCVCICVHKTGILMEEHASTEIKNESVLHFRLLFFSSFRIWCCRFVIVCVFRMIHCWIVCSVNELCQCIQKCVYVTRRETESILLSNASKTKMLLNHLLFLI